MYAKSNAIKIGYDDMNRINLTLMRKVMTFCVP